MFSILTTTGYPSPTNNFSVIFSLFLALLVSLSLTGCGEDSPTGYSPNGGNGGNDEPGQNEVWMEGHSFTPGNLEVEVGTTVTWTNQNSDVHTVTSGEDGEHDGIFNSGDIDPGASYSYEFTETGEFDYYCIPHVGSGMTGTVTVVNDNGQENGSNSNDGGNGGDNGGNGVDY